MYSCNVYILKQVKQKDFQGNQKDVGMVAKKISNKEGILNKAIITAPYIVLHNHPYISSCKPDLLRYLLQLLM